MRTIHPKRRSGFTLLEMLVVIAIIGILATLTGGGIFYVIQAQRQSNTESVMRTVVPILKKQMDAVVDVAKDQAKKGMIPAAVKSLAGNDPKRAERIWIKLRLKQEFPMSFAEAKSPHLNYAGSAVVVDGSGTTLAPSDLPGLPSYKNLPSWPPTVTSTQRAVLESSICLLMALQRQRSNISLSPDQLGSNAVDTYAPFTFDATSGKKLAVLAPISTGSKYLVDGWGSPIAFFRSPTGDPDLDATSPAGPDAPGNTNPAARYRDPLDPEGTLLKWNNWPNAATLVPSFESLCHSIRDSSGNAKARYIVPVLVSAGPNGVWGYKSPPSANPNNFEELFAMLPSPTNSANADDNICSYRLAPGKRGD